MSKVRRLASFAKKTPIPRTKTEPPNAFHARKVVLPRKEVHRAPIVWPGNLKKRQTRAKRFVSLVHRAITRTRQTGTRASNAHLGMPNRWPNKRRAFPASKESTTMSKVQRRASFAKQTHIPWTKTEPLNAFHVQAAVLPRKEVLRAPIVWPDNLKKRQALAKRHVPVVHRAITRTRPT